MGLDTCRSLPHSPQNFSPGSFAVPHAGQAAVSRAPQSAQNFRPSRFFPPHPLQRTLVFSFTLWPTTFTGVPASRAGRDGARPFDAQISIGAPHLSNPKSCRRRTGNALEYPEMTREVLPPWVVDNRTAVAREAAPYRALTPAERAQALAAACRAAARQLAARPDRQRLVEYRDPLPRSSVIILRRLRARAQSTA